MKQDLPNQMMSDAHPDSIDGDLAEFRPDAQPALGRVAAELHADGHIVPSPEHFDKLFMRKSELRLRRARFPDDSDPFYWNSFDQHVDIVDGERSFLGQVDLDAESDKVWDLYRETLEKLSSFGCSEVVPGAGFEPALHVRGRGF